MSLSSPTARTIRSMSASLFRPNPRRRVPIRNKRPPLWLERLEDRTNPAPFASNGLLGTLAPASQVAFDTTNGLYQVDGGAWQAGPAGGVALSGDPGQTTELFNFSTITLNANVTVTAFGNNALGLLATGNIIVAANLDFSGQNGQAGSAGYGHVGGGGGGGGGGAGAVILDTSGGTIVESGLLNIRGGVAGADGAAFQAGGDSGGQGGLGGLGSVDAGNGGAGGGSVAGGAGGMEAMQVARMQVAAEEEEGGSMMARLERPA